MKKRLFALALAGVLAAATLTGCGSLKGDETVATVDDTKIDADLANFFARYTQATYETYYSAYLGEDMWNSDASDGETYEESVKSSVLKSLEEEIQVIMKEIKQTKETLEMTPADRTDIIEECNRRLTVLEAYAPKMMGEDEIKAIIEGVLSELGIENPTGKDKGNIMKHLMPKVKGKADGKLVNDLVSTYFI